MERHAMRIYYSTPDELMLLDSLEGMNVLYRRLEAFLNSREGSIRLEADQWGSAEPHDELLSGLEVQKSKGPVMLSMTAGKWLLLTGSTDNLRQYVSHFHFEEDDTHHHPEGREGEGYISPISMGLMVEVSTAWVKELRGRRH